MALPLLNPSAFTMSKGRAMWCPGTTKPTQNGTVGYRLLGNCPGVNGTLSMEKAEMYSSMEGGNVLLDEAIKVKDLEATITCVDFSVKNLEMFAMGGEGNTSEDAQSSQTDTDVTFDSAVLDLFFPIGYYDITSVTVKDDSAGSPGTTTYTEDVDYEILLETGMIRFLSTGSISATDKIHVLVTAPATTTYLIKGYKADSQKGHFGFYGDPSRGECYIFEAYGEMTPDGELAMVGEDFGQMQFKFKAYVHSSYDNLFHLRPIKQVA